MTFFVNFMEDDASCTALQRLLFEILLLYFESYRKNVSTTSGDIEKRMKSGKVMVVNFENDRNDGRETYRKKFVSLSVVRILFEEPQNEELNKSTSEQSNLLFCYLEDFLYQNFWKWYHNIRGLDVDNYITERPTDSTYDYSETMLHKIYDITGYLRGHRIFNLIHLNRLRVEYKEVFQNYYDNSRHANGATALSHELPAQCLLFRDHSEGLYYAKRENFVFIKIVQAVWMQSLTTNVLILFNAFEPVKLVHKVILNSKNVQSAFQQSCYFLQDQFKDGVDLAVDDNPISFLFQFLINGFVRTYTKDIYQLRLSNALLSNTGASGIRTNILSFSAKAASSKSKCDNDVVNERNKSNNENENVNKKQKINENKKVNKSTSLNCSCGKNFIRVSWYEKHTLSCSTHKCAMSDESSTEQVVHQDPVLLSTLIELEGIELLAEHPDEDIMDKLRRAEKYMENEENHCDAALSSHLFIDDAEY